MLPIPNPRAPARRPLKYKAAGRRGWRIVPPLCAAAIACSTPWACAQEARAVDAMFAPRMGLVLDAGYGSREIALGARDRGLHLGGAEWMVSTPIGPYLEGRLTVGAHSHEGRLEKHIEEAWVGTTALPAGLQARAGRFMSQVGYLNEQHPHADDFVNRPLLYRAFLGGHYFDNGLRLNWTAPTALYWRSGVEVFGGRTLTPEVERRVRPGVWTLSSKVGGDLNREHSWQFGLSYLQNRRAAHAGHDDEPAGVAAEHDHAHGAPLAGTHLWMLDGVWKWAPGGNNRQEQLRLTFELARQTGLGAGGSHRAAYLAAVYRFGGQWEVGARADWLSARLAQGDAFGPGRLRELSLMAAWKPSHQQTVRVQFTQQARALGFENPGRAVYVQYIHSFGAHGAHSF